MPSLSKHSLLITGACLASSVSAAVSQLVGTWSTKSAAVITGPGFYNPINDSFIEPALTGISYSFTDDGFYEEAYFRAVSNPTDPSCPSGVMQFQHGTFVENSDGSLTLTPFSVDGRQLYSSPCEADTSTFSRYNQTETFETYQVYIDGYTKMTRLDLYEFDGTPMSPMYLAYDPPMMLPTVTMNPTATSTAASKAKRTVGSGEELVEPLNKHARHIKGNENPLARRLLHQADPSVLWWTGIGLMVFGGTVYFL